MEPSIGVFINVPYGQHLRCYFPGYITSTSSTRLLGSLILRDDLHMRRSTIRGNYWAPYIRRDFVAPNYISSSTSGSLSINENNFWTGAESFQGRSYQLNMTGTSLSVPTVYLSAYVPKPVSSYCAYSSFYYCRVYDSFVNRRYFVVAQWTGTTNTIRFNGTAYFPPTDDYSSSYYTTYIGWTDSNNDRYYHISSYSTNHGNLSPSTPSAGNNPMIFGSSLAGNPSTFIVSMNLNGVTLYRNSRDFGQN